MNAAKTLQQDFNQIARILNEKDAGNPAQAVAALQRLADSGLPKAAYNMSVAYLRGFHVRKDSLLAAHYMLKAAQAGYVGAYLPTAQFILEGQMPGFTHVSRDYQRYQSAKWLWRAAAQGNTRAMEILKQPWVPFLFNCIGRVSFK